MTPGKSTIPIFCDLTLSCFRRLCFCFPKCPACASGLPADFHAAVSGNITQMCPLIHGLENLLLLVRMSSASSFPLTESMWSPGVCARATVFHTCELWPSFYLFLLFPLDTPVVLPFGDPSRFQLCNVLHSLSLLLYSLSQLYSTSGDMKTVIPTGDSTGDMWKHSFLSFSGAPGAFLSVT